MSVGLETARDKSVFKGRGDPKLAFANFYGINTPHGIQFQLMNPLSK